jgi:plastocyanin
MMGRSVRLMAVVAVLAACGGDGGGVVDPDGGTLQGTVTGPGGGIPDALVSLSGGGSVRTEEDGTFSFDDVSAGQHTVTVTPPSEFQLASGETAAKSVSVSSGGTANVSWNVRLTNTSPRTVQVTMTAATFNAAEVTIPVGSTVNWVNQTATTHTISPTDASKPGSWDDTTISGLNADFDHTFGTAGTFDYVCKLHQGMTGVVRVH